MNKSAIKKFATSARKSLIDSIKKQALIYGIKKDKIDKPDYSSDDAVIINGIVYPKEIKDQIAKLISRHSAIGYDNLIEEVAYTWFNRFIALRFMEVNKYLPVNTLALSSSVKGKSEPDIITDTLKLNLPIDKEKIYYYQDKKDTSSLYKYLIITLCNHLYKYLPFMFEKINDYTELLFPDNILSSQSFIRVMIKNIPEEDFTQVEIIGWMYQFYVSERNDEVQALLKKNIKVTKDNIAPITQRFTPKWIVNYMVENTIGSYWASTYKESSLNVLKYLIKPAVQEDEVNKILLSITPSSINPEDIKVLDPSAGSGHILVYAFEILYQIYKEAGYMPSSIPKLILEKNLYGLEIDDRAAQLASFALLMKARSYKKDILDEQIIPNIVSIQESNDISGLNAIKYPNLNNLVNIFHDAKEYGSIIQIDIFDYDACIKELNNLKESQDLFSQNTCEKIAPLINQARIMKDRYDCVITNPPYMGSGNMNPSLSSYVKKHYKDSKSDMFAVFMELCIKMVRENGYVGMITQHQWMFLSSFEKLRSKLLNSITINSMVHLGPKAFEEIGGEVVQNTMFSFKNISIKEYNGSYIRLIDYDNALIKENKFFESNNRFYALQNNYVKIPGMPIAYWFSKSKIFKGKLIKDSYISGGRNKTHNDEKYLRYHWEIFKDDKWVLYAKGGDYRKYYGNELFVVNWSEEARNEYLSHGGLCNPKFWNKQGITWSLTSTINSFRIKKKELLYSSASPTIFNKKKESDYKALALLNSCFSGYILKILNPTLSTTVNDVFKIPYDEILIDDNINVSVQKIINISRQEWDSRETSWDFKTNELIRLKDNSNLIKNSVTAYINYWTDKFNILHSNEEELNKIFIDIYDIADELTPDVDKKDITILKDESTISNGDLVFKKEVLIKHLISYAVGIMFGRYSLDASGITYAGGEYDSSKYTLYIPDKDAILPVLSDDYFEDDIVSKFIEFLKVAFSKNTLSQNIEYIADTLGKTNNESSIDRIRRYFVKEFYKDHLKMYKKRPIYFMFSSGSLKAFSALVYVHRYNSSTLAKIRLDYLHHLLSKLDSTEAMLRNDKTTQAIKITRKLAEISKHRQELKKYDEILHHYADKSIEIDLDDGIKINYAKFGDLVVSI